MPDIASQAIPEFPALRIRPFANDRRLARRQAVHRQPSDLSAEGQPVRAPSLRRPFSSVEVAHLDVADLVGVEVHLGHLREDEVQELGAVEAADLGVEVELLDDVAGVGVEGGDPGAQVARDLAGVGEDGAQLGARGVLVLDAGHGLTGRGPRSGRSGSWRGRGPGPWWSRGRSRGGGAGRAAG